MFYGLTVRTMVDSTYNYLANLILILLQGYYTYKVIPTYRQTATGWKEVPKYNGGYSRGGY